MQIYAKGIDNLTLERPAGVGTQEWWKVSPEWSASWCWSPG